VTDTIREPNPPVIPALLLRGSSDRVLSFREKRRGVGKADLSRTGQTSYPVIRRGLSQKAQRLPRPRLRSCPLFGNRFRSHRQVRNGCPQMPTGVGLCFSTIQGHAETRRIPGGSIRALVLSSQRRFRRPPLLITYFWRRCAEGNDSPTPGWSPISPFRTNFRVAKNNRSKSVCTLFQFQRKHLNNQTVWPVIVGLTGPICVRALKSFGLLELQRRGHHDWPVKPTIHNLGSSLRARLSAPIEVVSRIPRYSRDCSRFARNHLRPKAISGSLSPK
jgi:hypothetical protein